MATFADLVDQLANAADTDKQGIKKKLNAMYNKDVKSASKSGAKSKSSVTTSASGVPETAFDIDKGTLNSLGGLGSIVEDYKQLVSIQREFIQQGGEHFSKFADGKEFNKSVAQAGETMFKYFGDIQTGQKAFFDTSKNMKAFIMVNNKTKDALAATVAVTGKLGIETSTMTGIFDTAIQSFGVTGEEAVNMGRRVANMSQQLAMSPQELASNFAKAQKSLLYDSGKVEGIFKKLQFTSRATGVSFDSLTSAFGSSMDSFQGSSEKAGKLNAILGKSVFNSMDLLGKSESERLETIVGGIRKNLRGGVQNLGKFELISIAEGLGMSPDETRRLLSGKTTVDQALKGKAPKDPREKALNQMAEQAQNVDESFRTLAETLRATRDPVQQAFIDMSSALRTQAQGAIEQVGGQVGINNIMEALMFASRAISRTDLDVAAMQRLVNQQRSLLQAIKDGEPDRAKKLVGAMEQGSTPRAGAPGGRRTDIAINLNSAFDNAVKVISGALEKMGINVNLVAKFNQDGKVEDVTKTKTIDANGQKLKAPAGQ